MQNDELANELERLANTDIRTPPDHDIDTTTRVAHLVRDNLPAILAALRTERKAPAEVEGLAGKLFDLADYFEPNDLTAATLIREAAALITHQATLLAERDAQIEALTPSGDTKADYHGEFSFIIKQVQEDEDGEAIEVDHRVYVPWTTVKEIMGAIRNRAARLALQEQRT